MMTYIEKNRGFLTSSKLKEFKRCAKCYYWKYEEEVPDPLAEFEDKDHFVIGQALDDRLTHGDDYYKANYAVVARRMGKTEGATEITKGTHEQVEMLYQEFRANNLFRQQPKKKILIFEYAGFKFKAELDDFDDERNLIVDVKTCANLTTFNPDFYKFQMAFYAWALREVEGRQCEAMLEVVDKYKYFARSRAIHYTHYTLESHMGDIITTIDKYKRCKELGVWISEANDDELLHCPYYGYKGHGRATKPLIY